MSRPEPATPAGGSRNGYRASALMQKISNPAIRSNGTDQDLLALLRRPSLRPLAAFFGRAREDGLMQPSWRFTEDGQTIGNSEAPQKTGLWEMVSAFYVRRAWGTTG